MNRQRSRRTSSGSDVLYADYDYYVNAFSGGGIAQEQFRRLMQEAGAQIDRLTQGRARSYRPCEPVKKAACAIAETLQFIEQGGDLVSQSVGSWSKAYAPKAQRSDETRIYDAAALYLANTGLLAGWL